MASFTMYLWEVIERERDPGTGMRIGLDRYPIFDESHREVLNRKIINRYMNREIGMETISMFKFALTRKLDEIMPMYNELYLSKLIAFDPLATFNLKTIREEKAKEESNRKSNVKSDTTSDSFSKGFQSNTPQNELPDNWEEDANFASSGSAAGSKSKAGTVSDTEDEGTGINETEGSSLITGFQGAASDLLNKYRATIINVDVMILDNISDCFMGVWDNGEEMLPSIDYLY